VALFATIGGCISLILLAYVLYLVYRRWFKSGTQQDDFPRGDNAKQKGEARAGSLPANNLSYHHTELWGAEGVNVPSEASVLVSHFHASGLLFNSGQEQCWVEKRGLRNVFKTQWRVSMVRSIVSNTMYID
jgi:hypothetical protein